MSKLDPVSYPNYPIASCFDGGYRTVRLVILHCADSFDFPNHCISLQILYENGANPKVLNVLRNIVYYIRYVPTLSNLPRTFSRGSFCLHFSAVLTLTRVLLSQFHCLHIY